MNKDSFQEIVESELDVLKNELSKVRAENHRLKEVIVENGLAKEIDGIDLVSIEEKICVDGIHHVDRLIQTHSHSDRDIRNFEIFYKTLQNIRGKVIKDRKAKSYTETDVKNLIKLVSSDE